MIILGLLGASEDPLQADLPTVVQWVEVIERVGVPLPFRV